MQKNVEQMYTTNVDPRRCKVEVLRKYTREQFAVVHFTPGRWGNCTKSKLKNISSQIMYRKHDHCSALVIFQ